MKRSFLLHSLFAVTIVCCFLFSSYTSRESVTTDTNDTLKLIIPNGWPLPVYDFKKNPVTVRGFELGRKLFFDPLLSKDSTISCASCHLQFTNFTHVDHALSHGIFGKKGTRNTLSIINAAWSKNFMWDGGVNNIEVQALAPIENPVEMDSKLADIVARLNRSENYRTRFKRAFGSEEISGQFVLKALAQYMVSMQSYNSKYDKVMRKEPGVAFSEYEAKGYALFKKQCSGCLPNRYLPTTRSKTTD
ncbi:MAG: putative cytochrome c peroxidase precursor [Bacteroidota bacterium]|jgi:cytochrome c peroxidase|nr:putative cytochrome c peroxidase precursor [Bacteroidota bacterium]